MTQHLGLTRLRVIISGAYLINLSRNDGVTIFISTHFMNEALRCDRMSMMHAGRVLDSASPAQLIKNRHAETLEEAFIGYLIDAGAGTKDQPNDLAKKILLKQMAVKKSCNAKPKKFSLRRLSSVAWRESLELARDPIRGHHGFKGVIILLLVMGYSITMDVEDLKMRRVGS